MNSRRTAMIGALGGMTIGAVLPMLWGDYNSFGLVSVLWSMIGGFFGIWLAVLLSKRFG